MDARLYDDVLSFTERIKETPEYRDYQQKKKLIAQNPELRAKAERLKKDNFEMLATLTEKTGFEEIMRFADEHEDTFMEPVINDYLLAEAAFCKIMREVFTMTMERIDF